MQQKVDLVHQSISYMLKIKAFDNKRPQREESSHDRSTSI